MYNIATRRAATSTTLHGDGPGPLHEQTLSRAHAIVKRSQLASACTSAYLTALGAPPPHAPPTLRRLGLRHRCASAYLNARTPCQLSARAWSTAPSAAGAAPSTTHAEAGSLRCTIGWGHQALAAHLEHEGALPMPCYGHHTLLRSTTVARNRIARRSYVPPWHAPLPLGASSTPGPIEWVGEWREGEWRVDEWRER